MIRGLEHLSYADRLRELGALQPGEEKVLGRFCCGLSMLKGGLIREMERDTEKCCPEKL